MAPSRSAARRPPTLDKHDLYERAVQAPEDEAAMLARLHARAVGRPLRTLREDFCGTAALARAFVARDPLNFAVGVDLHAPTLARARRALEALPDGAGARVRLVRGDVREVRAPEVDLLAALNFSWQVFATRRDLHAYFRRAARGVVPGGLVVADVWGGSDAHLVGTERRRLPGFTYVWERRSFDPLTYEIDARIHFELRGGRTLRDAFVYRWRLWPIPDVREAFEAAGLVDVAVLWEGTNPKTGGGDGVFRVAERGEACRSYVAYVVGRRADRAASKVNRTPSGRSTRKALRGR